MPDSIQPLFVLIGPLSMVFQIALCIHVYKTGRPYWWLWIILMAPVIGCILYILLEVLPDAHLPAPGIAGTSWLTPSRIIIRRAMEQLEEQDTVRNRLDLAALLHDSGRKEEAERIVSTCASGPFSNDADVISEVAWHQMAVGKYTEASQLIARADTRHNKIARNRLDLLKARILMVNGNYADALPAFTALQCANLGEAPRYYMALCLLGLDRPTEATALLNDITRRYRKAGKLWRRAEQNWYRESVRTLKTIRGGDAGKALHSIPH